jgi:chromosome partitioning protein
LHYDAGNIGQDLEFHQPKMMDLIPANIELSAFEVALVTAMCRETILRNLISGIRNKYDYILIDCMPSLGMTQLLQTISKIRQNINPKLNIDGFF